MQSLKAFSLFHQYRSKAEYLQKIFSANSFLRIGKGTRMVRKSRKYRRPEELEDPFYYGVGPKPEITAAAQSIKARGFGRERQSYKPPDDVQEKLLKICQRTFGSNLNPSLMEQTLRDPLLKYKVLTKSIQTFNKDIPSSILHSMKTVQDLMTYFSTPVDGIQHYDALLRDSDKLPPNLHVMPEASPFDPDTDTFFDGKSAYPTRRRIVYTKSGEKFEKIIEWPNV